MKKMLSSMFVFTGILFAQTYVGNEACLVCHNGSVATDATNHACQRI
ncbi:MAG: hypothetical protein HOG68_08495 [Candidatus Marinimicrobia bacterium]|nr:hypothetical protein [Candidatus Neomarinimicrobiota bacterium]MBT6709928.1 hypothetical protein [Candidatus Neomarinimicrobiota bacterium]